VTIRFGILAVLSGALALPLARLTQVTTADLINIQYWLTIATLAISGGAASTVTVLSILAKQTGVALPPTSPPPA
jgi:hypothetical protein